MTCVTGAKKFLGRITDECTNPISPRRLNLPRREGRSAFLCASAASFQKRRVRIVVSLGIYRGRPEPRSPIGWIGARLSLCPEPMLLMRTPAARAREERIQVCHLRAGRLAA